MEVNEKNFHKREVIKLKGTETIYPGQVRWHVNDGCMAVMKS